MQARINNTSAYSVWARFGYKKAGEAEWHYPGGGKGWIYLTGHGWDTLLLDEPSAGEWSDLEAISITVGAYYNKGDIYIDWVRGLVRGPKTLHVPSEFATIQSAIDAAINGDTVLIASGTYTGHGNEDIQIYGKKILITSESGAESTVIDVQGDDIDAFYLVDYGEDSTTIIDGLTIRRAWRGLNLQNSSPKLTNLRIYDCALYGIYTESPATPILNNCTIVNSSTGILISEGYRETRIENCDINDNKSRGIDIFSGRLILSHSNIIENNYGVHSMASGYEENGCLIDGCVFDGNNTGVWGFADVTNSTFRNGINGIGGNPTIAGYCYRVSNSVFEYITGSAVIAAGISTISNCIFQNNTGAIASIGGGEDPTIATFSDCDMLNNSGGVNASGYENRLEMTGCLYAGNGAPVSFNVGYSNGGLVIRSCTFAGNMMGAISVSTIDAPVNIDRTIIAFNGGYGLDYNDYEGTVSPISCSDVYMNDQNYVHIPDQTGINDNISADPLFCDAITGDYTLLDISPCSSDSNICGLVGKYDIGCYSPFDLVSSVDSLAFFEEVADVIIMVLEPVVITTSDASPVEFTVGAGSAWLQLSPETATTPQ